MTGVGATKLSTTRENDTWARADEVVTGEAVVLSLPAAGVIVRGASALIDVLIGALLLFGASWAAGAVGGADAAAARAVGVAAAVVIIVGIPLGVETVTRGRSVGKLVLGLRVVRDDGGAIGFRQAFVRALLGAVELYATIGGIAVLVALLHPQSKRLGDILAGTHAQSERVPKLRPTPVLLPPQLTSWAAIADVGRVPVALERSIAAFFTKAPHLDPRAREHTATALAVRVLPYVSPVPPAPPEHLLAAVVAVRRERDARALALEAQRMARLAPVLTGRPRGFPER
ncbi:MAG TPA: RDD family protein [Candidatus Lumbricidophila sp.]|nr:RDD family protein [Candidatus Lumbricidophila sp.]